MNNRARPRAKFDALILPGSSEGHARLKFWGQKANACRECVCENGLEQTVDFLAQLVDACSRTEMSMPPMSQIDVLLGKSIAKQRIASGISRENLAKKIGLSASTVTAFEQGTRRASAKQLFEIADVLELKIERLFNCPDNEPVEARPTTAAFSGQCEEIAGHYDALSKSHRVAIFAFLLALKSDKEENHPFMQ